ncbi:MAG: MaoC/PaaZ C-terminal domain-containing protein [Myxococcota bacterium]|nr:MaoC/PaaZ C-terminal domain-containing protein [Myxococcota bacterium]
MGVPIRHLRHQGRVLAAMGRTAALGLTSRLRGRAEASPPTPTPALSGVLPCLAADLITDAVHWAGGDPSRWGDQLPFWLHPQWGFPLLIRTLEGLPYPLSRALNAGCRVTVNAPLPTDQPLHVRVWLDQIDDDGRRAILHQKLITGTEDTPDALVVDFQVLVPLPKPKGQDGAKKKKKEKPTVPEDVREIARWTNSTRAGLEFALLTGDFNPIHWIPPAARLSGFKNTILHGFGTMARATERLITEELNGDPSRLTEIGVRFTRPVVLPAEVGLFVDDDGGLYVGDAPGGPAYLVGDYGVRDDAGESEDE